MQNHVEEYFLDKEMSAGSELFKVTDDNSDIKSEVTEQELRLINVLKMNDNFLASKGLKPAFMNYYRYFLRLKVSLNRQGRKEYVDINKVDTSGDTIEKMGAFSNYLNSRK